MNKQEDSEADKDGTKENQRDETDPFEDYHKVLQSTPISHVKVTTFNYEHPPTTSFYYLYTPQ